MADLARAGESVVISTGTASGKSLGYLMPSLDAVLRRRRRVTGAGAGVPPCLYIAPTKALAADQLRRIRDLGIPGIRVATYDGDTPGEEREWVRSHANFVLTNPDMLHHSLLPGHHRWASFLRRLDFVVIDEMHHYRGLFGAHVCGGLATACDESPRATTANPPSCWHPPRSASPRYPAARLTGNRRARSRTTPRREGR